MNITLIDCLFQQSSIDRRSFSSLTFISDDDEEASNSLSLLLFVSSTTTTKDSSIDPRFSLDIVNSIRIDLCQRRRDEQPRLIAVWKYPIDVAHLPVFCLVKVLDWNESSTDHHRNSSVFVQRISSKRIVPSKINHVDKVVALREHYFVKPNARSSFRRHSSPFCLYPAYRYGDRCEIEHDVCLCDPCQNNGLCLP